MMSREIENNPDPDDIWDYLKSIDAAMLEIEGDTIENAAQTVKAVQTALDNADGDEQADKLKDELEAAGAFHSFRESFGIELARLLENEYNVQSVKLDGKSYYGCVLRGYDYHFLILVPVLSMLMDTVEIWLLPVLIVELLLVYILGRISKEQRNRELKDAYIQLGQTQKRLEIALSAAQKAAAIDELTGMMNFGSFRKGVTEILENMCPEERGILIMIDGDHFKLINDNYGHQIGDEVIKLFAQMIIGRIRTVDLASRLHGDEFAIFVSDTEDYSVAKRIMEDINQTLAKEAQRRNMPSITMSAGAVTAKHGDSYLALAKVADAALYEAKVTHNGGFALKDMTRKENK